MTELLKAIEDFLDARKSLLREKSFYKASRYPVRSEHNASLRIARRRYTDALKMLELEYQLAESELARAPRGRNECV